MVTRMLDVTFLVVGMMTKEMHLQKMEGQKIENEYYNFSSFLFNWRKNQTAIHKGK